MQAEAPQAAQGADATQPDAASLTHELAGLIKQMTAVIAQDPSRKAALLGLATGAQTSLKQGDLAAAAAGIDTLRQALGPSATPGPQPAPGGASTAGGASPAIAKSRAAWIATRKKVEADIAGLHGAFSSSLKGHGMADELGTLFRTRVDTVLDTLDEALAHKLDDIDKADAAGRAKLVDDAHALIARYQAHVAGDPTIALLDKNPFTPLAIEKTMTATLAALSKAIH